LPIKKSAPIAVVEDVSVIQLQQEDKMAIVDEYRAHMKARASATSAELEEMKITEQWLAIRKEEGLKINPDTAEVYGEYGFPVDPYGVYTDLCEEEM
jgi:hypothetical protein